MGWLQFGAVLADRQDSSCSSLRCHPGFSGVLPEHLGPLPTDFSELVSSAERRRAHSAPSLPVPIAKTGTFTFTWVSQSSVLFTSTLGRSGQTWGRKEMSEESIKLGSRASGGTNQASLLRRPAATQGEAGCACRARRLR